MGPDAEEAARSLGSVRLGPAFRRHSLIGPTGCPFIPGRARRRGSLGVRPGEQRSKGRAELGLGGNYAPEVEGGSGKRSAWQIPPEAQFDLSTSLSNTSTACSGQPIEVTTASVTLRISAFFCSGVRPDQMSIRTMGMMVPLFHSLPLSW